MSNIPNLPHHCNSWVVTRKADDEVIGEFYNRENIERFNPEKVIIETADVYLCGLNKISRGKES